MQLDFGRRKIDSFLMPSGMKGSRTNCVNMQKKKSNTRTWGRLQFPSALSASARARCTTNSWVRCTGATSGNSRFNRTDPHWAAPTHRWSHSVNTPDIDCPAVESVQLTATRTSSAYDDGADGSFKCVWCFAQLSGLCENFSDAKLYGIKNSNDCYPFFMCHSRSKSELFS